METQVEKNNKFSKASLLPLGFFLIYLGLVVWFRFSLPSQEQILEFVRNLYREFGYLIVFFAGFLEALFLIGMYLPGSTAILLGAVLSSSGVVFLPLIIIFGTLGMLLGYIVNYILGKYGWYHLLLRFGMEKPLRTAEAKLAAHGTKALFFSYLAPSGGAFISTAAGITKLPFRKFLIISTASQTFWSILWGTIAYLVGEVFITIFFQYIVLVVYVIVGYIILRNVFKRKFFRWF